MTFIIQETFEMNDKSKSYLQVFDVEAYNYIFRNGTIFTDGEFVKTDHRQLERVLQYF